MERIKKELKIHPQVKISLEVKKKNGKGWRSHSSYVYRRNRDTGRMRLVKL